HAGQARKVVAVGVGVPHRVLVGRAVLPRHLVTARRLQIGRASCREGLYGGVVAAAVPQRRGVAGAGERDEISNHMAEPGRAEALEGAGELEADRGVAVEVLLEARLQSLQLRA